MNFDVLMNFNKPRKNSKKYVFILNEDHDLNRNLLVKAEKLAKRNPENKYFTMLGSEENKNFLKEIFGVEFKTYPQMIRIDEEKGKEKDNVSRPKALVFPVNDLLSYKIDLETLNEKVRNMI